MSDTTKSRFQSAIVAIAPVVLLAAFLWHPYLPGRLPNDAAVATAVAADTTRWGFAHLAAGVASGVAVLAFIAIRSYLREAGETRWSALGLPFIRQLTDAFPDAAYESVYAHESGDTAVDEGYLVGTNTEPLAMPTGESIPATGKRIRVRSCDVATVQNGLITSHRFYFDQMEFLGQLGLLPE